MAITLTILQASGNPVRSAMAKLDFDDEVAVPADAELTITAEVLDAEGGDVNASAEIVTAASGAISTDAFAQEFVDDLVASRTGAMIWLAKNTSDEYIVHFEPRAGIAQTVNLSGASYVAVPA